MNFRQIPAPPHSKKSGVLANRFGDSILICHVCRQGLDELVLNGRVDSLLIEPEDGFSLLGGAREFLSNELGIGKRDLVKWVVDSMAPDFEPNISSLAEWARDTDPDITLVGVQSRKPRSQLKGLVLVPYEGSLCYRQFAQPQYGKPYRDFFYNVTYEAMYYAYSILGARRFAISHLSCTKYLREGYRMDITRSQIDAIVHFCNQYQGVKEITFWDDGEGNHPVEALTCMRPGEFAGFHKDIQRSYEQHIGIDFISLYWTLPGDHKSNAIPTSAAPG
jgi:hypothetical protein